MRRIVAAGLLSLALSGCMTMKGFNEAGNEYAKGNYIAGTWTSLMSLTILPIVDVATLGGTLTPEQTASAVSQVAQSRNKGTAAVPQPSTPTPTYSPTPPSYEPPAASASTYSASTGSGTGSSSRNTGSGTSGGTSGSTASPGASTKSGPQYSNIPSQTGCLKGVITGQDSVSYNYEIQNSCPYAVNAYWCDRDGCTRATNMDTIRSGGKANSFALKKYGRPRFGVIHGCQLRSGQYEVLYNHDTNQCYTQITT